jgi:hypothetical protein
MYINVTAVIYISSGVFISFDCTDPEDILTQTVIFGFTGNA